MINNVIENKIYVQKIIYESKENTDEAEKYMHEEIELNFPEIAKAIQMRRASYYLLQHEYQYVDQMLKKGQIEEKEANQFKSEIDKMIVDLELHDPEIKLEDQHVKVMKFSELA